jgi:hypothetical protein
MDKRQYTKAQVIKLFRTEWAAMVKVNPSYKQDRPARRLVWSTLVDRLNKAGCVTDRQAMTWTSPVA